MAFLFFLHLGSNNQIVMSVRVTILLIVFILYGCENQEVISSSKFNNSKIKKALLLSNNKELEVHKRLQLIDSAYQSKRALDSLSLAVLYQKSNIHYELKQIDSSYYYDKLLLKKSHRINNYYFMGKSSQGIAYYFKKKGVYDSAYFYYNQVKNIFQNLKDSSQAGRGLMDMGIIQKNRDDFFGSKETLTEALQYLHPQKDIKFISSCYNTLGTNHRKLFNYPDAIAYYKKAIEKTRSSKDKLRYKNNLAVTYIDNGDYNNAIKFLKEIITDSLLKGKGLQYARGIDNLAYANWLSGKNEVEAEFKNALNIRLQNNDKRGQIANYTHLGEYHAKNNLQKAHPYFDSVVRLSRVLKMPKAEKDVLKFLIDLNPNKIELRDRYVFLQDSLYKQELKVKTQFAKYKYDDKLKQESILRLQKEKAEKQLEVVHQRSQIIYTSFGFLILLLASGFVFYFFKQRNKNLKRKTLYLEQRNKIESLEATYKTEAKLSRRVHDDFGGQLNQALVLVQNNAPKAKILDVLGGAYDQSRHFSREINEIETGPKYADELFAMLSSQTPQNTKLYITGRNDIDWLAINALSKLTIYKVLLQLMMNMKEHSHAKLVTISFKSTEDTLKINYIDDGVGASSDELNTKNGLRNTENRIQAINGTIIFDSEKEEGFKAEIEIPN